MPIEVFLDPVLPRDLTARGSSPNRFSPCDYFDSLLPQEESIVATTFRCVRVLLG
jgi:hypothetical protein